MPRALLVWLLLLPGLALAADPAAASARGVGELALDPWALVALIGAAMPEPSRVDVPGLGTVTLALTPPRRIVFREGGIEARVGLTLRELGLEGAMRVRYEPFLERESGRLGLAAVRAEGEGALALLPDIAPLLPPAELPRTLRWLLPDPEAPRNALTLDVQRVEVREERLVIAFGLVARPLR